MRAVTPNRGSNGRMISRLLLPLALAVVLLGGREGSGQGVAAHPLDALSAGEITAAVQTAARAGHLVPGTSVIYVMLNPPDKKAVLSGARTAREARLLLYRREENLYREVIVDLGASRITRSRVLTGAQPRLQAEDRVAASEIISTDPRWAAALARRGLGAADVSVIASPAGAYGPAEPPPGRVALVTAVYNAPRAGQVGGLRALADLTERRVLWIMDQPVRELAVTSQQAYGPHTGRAISGLLQPLQPGRPPGNLRVNGGMVTWGNWRFHLAIHPRDGLQLSVVQFRDAARWRSVLYQASLSEIVVPYGDPGWLGIAPFDAGDAGLAVYGLSSLQRGVDAPADAQFVDAVLNDPQGRAVTVPRAVGLYERFGGPLWRHGTDGRSGQELVVTSYVTIDNYDYGVEWIFSQAGAIRVDVVMTGMMNFRAVRSDEGMASGSQHYGHSMDRTVFAPNHQHFFNFRLDFDVDGADGNRVVEIDTRAGAPVEGFPLTPIVMTESVLRDEKSAARDTDSRLSRKWRVESAESAHGGHRSGYFLVPDANPPALMNRGSWLSGAGGFLSSQLWVTPQSAGEQHAAGEHTWQGAAGQGLPAWTADNRSIDGRDLVVWYTVGATHLPRPEDWPIMPAVRSGFSLQPAGFFPANPAVGAGA